MRDYWLTRDLLQAAGTGYLLIVLIALAAVVWFARGKVMKALGAAVVLGLGSILPWKSYQESVKVQQKISEFQRRQAAARAVFDERCKKAGEKIYKTVEGVEDLLLVDTRGSYDISNFSLRDWKYAGFPSESSGKQYVMEFLYYNRPASGSRARSLGKTPGGMRGYTTVTADLDGRPRRLNLKAQAEYRNLGDSVLDYANELPLSVVPPRYAVRYEDVSDPETRVHWVAGGRVVIVDQLEQAVLGEFIRYAFEPGLGSTVGSRSPWMFAVQCPASAYGGSSGHIRSFVERVLVPVQGGQ